MADGQRTLVEILSVDISHPPASYAIRMPGTDVTRETEADRLEALSAEQKLEHSAQLQPPAGAHASAWIMFWLQRWLAPSAWSVTAQACGHLSDAAVMPDAHVKAIHWAALCMLCLGSQACWHACSLSRLWAEAGVCCAVKAEAAASATGAVPADQPLKPLSVQPAAALVPPSADVPFKPAPAEAAPTDTAAAAAAVPAAKPKAASTPAAAAKVTPLADGESAPAQLLPPPKTPVPAHLRKETPAKARPATVVLKNLAAVQPGLSRDNGTASDEAAKAPAAPEPPSAAATKAKSGAAKPSAAQAKPGGAPSGDEPQKEAKKSSAVHPLVQVQPATVDWRVSWSCLTISGVTEPSLLVLL